MPRAHPGELDYFKLIKRLKRLDAKACGKTVRLALLSDAASQQLVTVLRVLLHDAGIHAEVFEAGFDTIEAEVFNPASELYAFKPEVIVLLHSTAALKARYYAHPGDKATFADAALARIVALWDGIKSQCSATVIQSNFIAPVERLFGNYDHKVAASLYASVQALNLHLAEKSRDYPHVLINDVEALASYVGRGAWFDEKLWTLAKSPCALEHLPRLAGNVADIIATRLGRVVKCVVLDLDNTVWGGVIGDDGMDGIRLGHLGDGEAFHNLQQFVLELSRRGILLAVCSKNTHETALRVFREHPEMVLREKDITVFKANWDNKANNLQAIREVLNIGYDSMVFLDDNPFERNLVREMLPEVIVPELPEEPSEYVKYLAELNLFEATSHSALDQQRGELYREEAQRQDVKQRFENLDDYLRSLEMKVTLARFDAFNLPRIAQLIQRSNQFNLATRRYTEAQCEAFMLDLEGHDPLCVSLLDRFGSYGLISVVVLRHEARTVFIDEYLMSCRVLQRGVEQYTMNQIFERARARGAEAVVGYFYPTAKNAMVKDFYHQFGFEKVSEDDAGNTTWRLAVDAYVPRVVQMEAVAGEDARAGGSESPGPGGAAAKAH